MEEAMGSVISERKGSVGILRLNEPKTLNALSPSLKAGLEAALPAFLDDPTIRAIVLTGEGRAFCAGGDLRAMNGLTAPLAHTRMQNNYRWLKPLMRAKKPVITAVNGVAAGAGFSLALTGDIVVLAGDAKFKAGFPGVGLVPDLALGFILPRAVGIIRAKEILFTNREIHAPEALRIGLASVLAEPGEAMDTALHIAQELAQGPTLSYALGKDLYEHAFDKSLDAYLDAEGAAQTVAFGSHDCAEGVKAFSRKESRFLPETESVTERD